MMTWEQLARSCYRCNRCALADFRKKVVFGTGNPQAKLLFVGNAPDTEEDRCGVPFVGEAGRLLETYLALIDLNRRQHLFITNMIKCCPPPNRTPLATEQICCLDFLRYQVAIMRPTMIACFGEEVCTALIDKNFVLSRDHGVFFEKNGVILVGYHHPTTLLRQPEHRSDMLADIKLLKQQILIDCPDVYHTPPL